MVKTIRKETDLYLHGVSLPRGGLAIGKDGAVISTQNICQEHRRAHKHTSSKHNVLRAWLVPHLSRSAWHRCCTPVPGWCWWGTHGRRKRSSPVESTDITGQFNCLDKQKKKKKQNS